MVKELVFQVSRQVVRVIFDCEAPDYLSGQILRITESALTLKPINEWLKQWYDSLGVSVMVFIN
jgi:hypothetical protein